MVELDEISFEQYLYTNKVYGHTGLLGPSHLSTWDGHYCDKTIESTRFSIISFSPITTILITSFFFSF